jgi:hypothetical protein
VDGDLRRRGLAVLVAGVEEVVRLAEGAESGVGSVFRNVWRSRLPYAVRFDARTTRIERGRLIEATATGELAGMGRWRLFAAEDALAVTYERNPCARRGRG